MQASSTTMRLIVPQPQLSLPPKAKEMSSSIREEKLNLTYSRNRTDKRGSLPFTRNHPYTALQGKFGHYLLIAPTNKNTKVGLRVEDDAPVYIWKPSELLSWYMIREHPACTSYRVHQYSILNRIHTIHQRLGHFSDLISSIDCKKNITHYLIAECHPTLSTYLNTEQPADKRNLISIADSLLGALDAIHSKRITHGAISEQTLFVKNDGQLYIGHFGETALKDNDINCRHKDADVVALLKALQLLTRGPSFRGLPLTQQYALQIISRDILIESPLPPFKLNLQNFRTFLMKIPKLSTTQNYSKEDLKTLLFKDQNLYYQIAKLRITDPLLAAKQFAAGLKSGEIYIDFNNSNRVDKGYCFRLSASKWAPETSKSLPFTILRHSDDLYIIVNTNQYNVPFTKLGQGAYGKVRVAYDVSNDCAVAVKKSASVKGDFKQVSELYKKNHEMSDTLGRKSVLIESTDSKHTQRLYLISPLMQGDLSHFLSLPKNYSVTKVLTMFKLYAEAISNFHNFGFVHRDIKLENTLYSETENGELVVQLSDFDFSKKITHPTLDSESSTTDQGLLNFCEWRVDTWNFGRDILRTMFPSAYSNSHDYFKKRPGEASLLDKQEILTYLTKYAQIELASQNTSVYQLMSDTQRCYIMEALQRCYSFSYREWLSAAKLSELFHSALTNERQDT